MLMKVEHIIRDWLVENPDFIEQKLRYSILKTAMWLRTVIVNGK